MLISRGMMGKTVFIVISSVPIPTPCYQWIEPHCRTCYGDVGVTNTIPKVADKLTLTAILFLNVKLLSELLLQFPTRTRQSPLEAPQRSRD